MRNLRDSKGFTLIELMIVVVIIDILAAIAIPKFTSVSKSAKEAEAGPVLKQICALAESEYLKNNAYPADIAALTTAGFTDPSAKYYTFTYSGTSNTATGTAVSGTGVANKSMNCATKVIS